MKKLNNSVTDPSQHYLTMFGATVSLPILMSPKLCVNDPVVTGKLISTIFFVSGIATLLQTCLGNRYVNACIHSVLSVTLSQSDTLKS